MTEPIMNLARASGEGADLMTDAKQSAELVTGSIRAYEMAAKDAAYISDLMAASVNNSNFTLEELIVSMQYAAPAAHRYGVSIEDTLAALAGMRDLNLDASIAGTAFRNMLVYLSQEKERTKFNDSLKELTGNTIDFVDAAGNLKSLPHILFAMSRAMDGLGSSVKGDMLNEMFGTRANIPASVLGERMGSFAQMISILKASAGIAKATQEKMETGVGGAFRETESAIEGIAIAIGESLDDSIITAVQKFKVLAASATEWIMANRGVIVAVTATIIGLGALGIALITLGMAIRMSTGVLFTLSGALRIVGTSLRFITSSVINVGRIVIMTTAQVARNIITLLAMIVSTTASMVYSIFAAILPAIIQSLVMVLLYIESLFMLGVTAGLPVAGAVLAIAAALLVLSAYIFIAIAAWQIFTQGVTGAFEGAKQAVRDVIATVYAAGQLIGELATWIFQKISQGVNHLISRFMDLINFLAPIGGVILDALAVGDIELAMSQAWKTIKVLWAQGIMEILNMWDTMMMKFQNSMTWVAAELNHMMTMFKRMYPMLAMLVSAFGMLHAEFATEAAQIVADIHDVMQMGQEGLLSHKTTPEEEEIYNFRQTALDRKIRERREELAKLEQDLADELQKLPRDAMQAEMDKVTADFEAKRLELEGKLNELIKGNPIGEAGGLHAPTLNKGAVKGSTQAAQDFKENKFAMYGKIVDEIAKNLAESKRFLESIDKHLKEQPEVGIA
jgi:TP901 family phage tail tape measure protein